MPTGCRNPRALALAAAAALAVALGGCGGDDQPDYCSDRSALQDAIEGLPGAATSGDLDQLRGQVETVKSDAANLADSARSDFPDETAAVRSSADELDQAVSGLPSDPSASQLAGVATDAVAVVDAVRRFVSATGSACD